MKKLLAIILAVALVMGLAACGSGSGGAPDGWNADAYRYAEAGYELVRDYNTGKVSTSDAKERVGTILNNIRSVNITEQNSTKKLQQETNKLSATSSLSSFQMKLSTGGSAVSEEQSLKRILKK